MANIGATVLEPLETLGGGGRNFGDGTADGNSNRLPALTTSGYNEQRNAGGALTLPLLEVTFTMLEGGSGSADFLLPTLEITGNTGGQGEMDLPFLTMTGSGTVFAQGFASFNLPLVTVAGSGLAGTNGSAAILLPLITASGYTAGRGAAVLPLITVAGTATRVEQGSGALTLPLLQISGDVSIQGYAAVGAFDLPALVAGQNGARADFMLPLLAVNGFDAGSIAGSGAGAFEGWALNMRNGLVTRITNWPFTQIVQWGSKVLGVAADGLYLIGGDTDAPGVPIQWEWRTGLDDLGQPGVKRIPVLYVDGIIDGEVFIITKDDQGNVRKYRYEAERGRRHMPHRRELGKGVRTRNIAFGMSNGPGGAYMEIDGLEPEATVTQRSI